MNKKDKNDDNYANNVFGLTPDKLANCPEYDKGKVLNKANWKVRQLCTFLPETESIKEDLIQDYLLTIWYKRYEFEPNIGSRGSYAAGIIEGMAKNDYRKIKRRSYTEGLSLDVPIDGGKDDSRPLTHADCYSDETQLLPLNYRGALRIGTDVDLKLIRQIMPKIDWFIFINRWKYGTSNADLAKKLGWSENKLRWHLKKYEQRYAKLLGVKRHR